MLLTLASAFTNAGSGCVLAPGSRHERRTPKLETMPVMLLPPSEREINLHMSGYKSTKSTQDVMGEHIAVHVLVEKKKRKTQPTALPIV